MATMTAAPSVLGYMPRRRWVRVRIETEDGSFVGRVHVPETRKRLSDVLCDERSFILLTDVTINDAQSVEPFVALNKAFVRTVRVLNELEEAPAPLKVR